MLFITAYISVRLEGALCSSESVNVLGTKEIAVYNIFIVVNHTHTHCMHTLLVMLYI